MNTFKQSAHRLKYYNSGGTTVTVDTVVVIGDMVGIVVADILKTSYGVLEIDGVHVLAAKAGESWTQGTQLYWDDTNDWLVDVADSHKKAGRAAAAKAQADTTAEVILNNNG